MSERAGGSGYPEAGAERLSATLASVEAVNSSKADADDAMLIETGRAAWPPDYALIDECVT